MATWARFLALALHMPVQGEMGEAFLCHLEGLTESCACCVLQGEMGEAFLGHLEDLAKKLDYVASDDTARFSAAFR